MSYKSKGRPSSFTMVAGVVLILTSLVDFGYAQYVVPWPQQTKTGSDGTCDMQGQCPPAMCLAFSYTCNGIGDMKFEKYYTTRGFGNGCGGITGKCYKGTLYPCAYLLYFDGDNICMTPKCWYFPAYFDPYCTNQ